MSHNLPWITLAESQDAPELAINDSFAMFDALLSEATTISVIADVSLTEAQVPNGVIIIAGIDAPDRVVDLPAIKRQYLVYADPANTDPVSIRRGAKSMSFNPGDGVAVYTDGTDDGIILFARTGNVTTTTPTAPTTGGAKDFTKPNVTGAASSLWSSGISGVVAISVLAGETISKVVIRPAQTNTLSRLTAYLFADVGGKPSGSPLASSSLIAGTVADTDQELAFTTPWVAPSDQTVWIGFYESASSFNIYQTAGNGQYWSGAAPPPSTPSVFANRWAIWATGTAAGTSAGTSTTVQGGIVDAPNNANAYVRKGGAWVTGVTAADFGTLTGRVDAIMSGSNGAVDTFIEAYNRFIADESAASALTTTVGTKLTTPAGGGNGDVLTKTSSGFAWVTPITSLIGLADVNVVEGAGIDGYRLTWSQSSGRWIAVAPSSGGITGIVGDDEGVVKGTFTTINFTGAGVTASFSGSTLTVDVPGGSGGGSTTLATLTDVQVTEGAGIDGYALYWDNATSKWKAKAFPAGGGSSTTTPILNNMTGYTAPTGNTASAKSEYTAGPNLAWHAFDGSSTSFWSNNGDGFPSWLQRQFAVANAITGYKVKMRGAVTAAPTAWTLQGSNDGTTWTGLDSQTAQSFASSEEKTYNLSGTTAAYTYFRLNITAGVHAAYVDIAELTLIAGAVVTPVALASLSDVVIGTPTDGQVLKYDGATNKWKPAADNVGSGSASTPATTADAPHKWNPIDKAAGITLSNNNLTATRPTGSSWQNVRGTTGKSTGKVAFAIKIDAAPTTDSGTVGFMSASDALTGAYVGADLHGFGITQAGQLNTKGGTPSGRSLGASLATNDVIQFNIDFAAGMMYVAQNGVWKIGDPVAGTGGFALGETGQNYYPGFGTNGTQMQVTAVAPAAVTGYSAWETTVTANGNQVVPTVVQSVASILGTSGNPSPTLAAAPTQGNLLIYIGTHYPNTVTPATGWTELTGSHSDGVTNDGNTILYKFAGAGESATQTPTTSGIGGAGVLFEVSGVVSTGFLDLIVAVKEQNVTSQTGTVVTTGAKELVLGAAIITNSAAQIPSVTGTGITIDAALPPSLSRSVVGFHYGQDAAGSNTVTASAAVAHPTNLIEVAIKPVAATGSSSGSTSSGNTTQTAWLATVSALALATHLAGPGVLADSFKTNTGFDTSAITTMTWDNTNALMTSVETSTALLLHMDGANGSTTYTDTTGKTISVRGDGSNGGISTTQSKFGGASAFNPRLTTATHADFGFAGDFTLEGWFWITASTPPDVMTLFDLRQSNGPSNADFALDTAFKHRIYFNGAVTLGTTPVPTGQWVHLAYVRNGTTLTCYTNGVADLVISGSGVAGTVGANPGFASIGALTGFSGQYFFGYMDEIRFSKNARYTANFTPPTAVFGTTSASTELRSIAVPAMAAPTTGKLYFVFETVSGTVTPGTTVSAAMSRDNGTTWTDIPLTKTNIAGTGRDVYEGSASLAAQPTGTQMKYKLIAQPGLTIKIHDACMQWS